MEHRPPIEMIVRVPGCVFTLSDFSNAREIKNGSADALKIEFKKGTYHIIEGHTLDELMEAMRSAAPPSVPVMPTK